MRRRIADTSHLDFIISSVIEVHETLRKASVDLNSLTAGYNASRSQSRNDIQSGSPHESPNEASSSLGWPLPALKQDHVNLAEHPDRRGVGE
jgi:hypothetical protein